MPVACGPVLAVARCWSGGSREGEIDAGVSQPGRLPQPAFARKWDHASAKKREFGDRESMTNEVLALRPEHNYSTATAIRDVARALRKHVDERAFDRVLAKMPRPAVDFWEP